MALWKICIKYILSTKSLDLSYPTIFFKLDNFLFRLIKILEQSEQFCWKPQSCHFKYQRKYTLVVTYQLYIYRRKLTKSFGDIEEKNTYFISFLQHKFLHLKFYLNLSDSIFYLGEIYGKLYSVYSGLASQEHLRSAHRIQKTDIAFDVRNCYQVVLCSAGRTTSRILNKIG